MRSIIHTTLTNLNAARIAYDFLHILHISAWVSSRKAFGVSKIFRQRNLLWTRNYLDPSCKDFRRTAPKEAPQLEGQCERRVLRCALGVFLPLQLHILLAKRAGRDAHTHTHTRSQALTLSKNSPPSPSQSKLKCNAPSAETSLLHACACHLRSRYISLWSAGVNSRITYVCWGDSIELKVLNKNRLARDPSLGPDWIRNLLEAVCS